MAAQTINVSGIAALRYVLAVASTQFFFTNAVDGQKLRLTLQQDGTGGRVVTSGNCPGIMQPSAGANTDSTQELVYDAVSNKWAAIPQQLAPGSLVLSSTTTNTAIAWQKGYMLLSGTLTVTITNPVSGPPNSGGNDGEVMVFTSIGTGVTKVTMTVTETINALSTSVSNAGAVGDGFQLLAFGGNVYLFAVIGASTLS